MKQTYALRVCDILTHSEIKISEEKVNEWLQYAGMCSE
jgi:hypothetical protein